MLQEDLIVIQMKDSSWNASSHTISMVNGRQETYGLIAQENSWIIFQHLTNGHVWTLVANLT